MFSINTQILGSLAGTNVNGIQTIVLKDSKAMDKIAKLLNPTKIKSSLIVHDIPVRSLQSNTIRRTASISFKFKRFNSRICGQQIF